MAVFLVTERASEEQIEQIASLHVRPPERRRQQMTESPGELLVEHNDAFHAAIVEAAGNERLSAFLQRNREFFFTDRIARLYSEEQAADSLAGHDEIVAALRARDGDRAACAMRGHILQARDVIIAQLATRY
jgi:DNA-binding GntR family transcriptional regulator